MGEWKFFSICLSSWSSCLAVLPWLLLLFFINLCRFGSFSSFFFSVFGLRFFGSSVLCHCHRLRLRFVVLISGFGKWFHYFLCCFYDLITRKIILLLYIHTRTWVRMWVWVWVRVWVLLSAIILFSVRRRIYDLWLFLWLDSRQRYWRSFGFAFGFTTHRIDRYIDGERERAPLRGTVVSLINRHTSLCGWVGPWLAGRSQFTAGVGGTVGLSPPSKCCPHQDWRL